MANAAKLSHYEELFSINKGSFAEVYACKYRGEICACKKISKYGEQSREAIMKEVEIHKRLNHFNIAKFIDFEEDSEFGYIFMELVPGKDLITFIEQKGIPTLKLAQSFLQQMVVAIEHCHEMGVAHRDVKLENFVVMHDSILKMVDFGFAEYLYENNGTKFQQTEDQESRLLNKSCGSIHYAPPEIIRGEKYKGESVDIFSLGVTFYAIVHGRFPFDDSTDKDVAEDILKYEPIVDKSVDEDCAKLIYWMSEKDPSNRPTILDIKMSPFYRKRFDNLIDELI